MKKKTSLWISGITTVAMLAVAVGSFAAWDTLTANPVSLTATSGNPAVLDFKQEGTPSTDKLVPSDAIVVTGEATELTLGTVTATLKTEDASPTDKSNGATIKCTAAISDTAEGASPVDLSDKYTVELTEGSNPKTLDKTTGVEISANTSYSVKLKFKDGLSADEQKALKGKSLSINITAQAEKKSAQLLKEYESSGE